MFPRTANEALGEQKSWAINLALGSNHVVVYCLSVKCRKLSQSIVVIDTSVRQCDFKFRLGSLT